MKEKVEILLVRLPLPEEERFVNQISDYVGFGYLSSGLRQKGFSVKILDFYLEPCTFDEIVNEILKYDTKIIGFTIMIQNIIDSCLKVINALRSVGVKSHITCGGHLPSLKFEDVLTQIPELDSIVRFEGEITFIELADCIINGGEWRDVEGLAYRNDRGVAKSNKIRPLIKDLNELNFPDRDTLPNIIKKGGIAGILSSRGCYADCSFCSIYPFYNIPEGKNWRHRSPENVVDEIEFINKNYDMKYFIFYDDDFIGPGEIGKKRAHEIAELIINRKLDINFYIETRVNDIDYNLFKKLKESGLNRVFLGIESGVQSVLNKYNKNITCDQQIESIKILNDLGLKVIVGFMMFNPYLTLQEFKENFNYLVKYDLLNFFNLVSFYSVLGGTKLEDELKNKGLLIDNDYRKGYEIIDSKVSLLYEMLSKATKPLERVYLKIKKAEYDFYVYKSSIDLEIYDDINKQLNIYLIEITESITNTIEKYDEMQTNEKKLYEQTERWFKKSLDMAEKLLFISNFYEKSIEEGESFESSFKLSV